VIERAQIKRKSSKEHKIREKLEKQRAIIANESQSNKIEIRRVQDEEDKNNDIRDILTTFILQQYLYLPIKISSLEVWKDQITRG
jgi:hypothetical protein